MNLRTNIIRAVLLFGVFLTAAQAVSAQSLGLNTVVIDPGHGGKDPGCVSSDNKTMEKAIVLDISERLQKKINAAYPKVKVKMTRSKDTFVELNNRAKFASDNNASLFISVHINSADKKNTSPNGYSVHILGPSADKNKDTYAFNMDVCKRENEVIYLEEDYSTTYQGFDPNDPGSDIFLRLMANSYREQSLLFAQIVDMKLKGGPIVKDNGIYQNNFAVLRLASMPAVLLELGFMSNPSDLAQLRKSASLEKIADALFEAFSEYKKLYDESVGAKSDGPDREALKQAASAKAEPEVEKKEEPASKEEEEVKSDTYYATQVLATGKTMDPKDKYFLGYEPKKISSGKLNKYMIGVSEDLSKAKEMYKEIKKKYPDSFLVKVSGESSVRINQ